MSPIRTRPISRSCLLAATAAVGALLSACYVVPIDPRTAPRDTAGQVTVITPPAASVPSPSVLTARLYPLNPQAQQGGMLTAVVVDQQTGRGNFTVAYLGDTLQGEATRVDASYAAFGRIHSEVLGTPPRLYGGRRGIANAFGAKGHSVQCEYQITGPSMGTGACQFSDGARYQMHFGA